MRVRIRSILVGAFAGLFNMMSGAAAPTPDDEAFRALYKELVEKQNSSALAAHSVKHRGKAGYALAH